MRRFFAIILMVACLLGCYGCGKKYNEFYGQSEVAVTILTDAVELLEKCQDGELTAEATVNQLEVLINRYDYIKDEEDMPEETTVLAGQIAVLNVEIACGGIDIALSKCDRGTGTVLEVEEAVQSGLDSLRDSLYE